MNSKEKENKRGWPLRIFLLRGAVVIATICAGMVPVLLAGGATGGKHTVTRNRLHIPPAINLSQLLSLQAKTDTVNLGDDVNKLSEALTYAYNNGINGFFPGPTIRANRNDSAYIDFTNRLAEETTIHWHGMIVPPQADGHPLDKVDPGGTYSYQFTIQQRAALNWYHPHPHMLTGKQVALGLAGAFIVNDSEEAALGLPSGSYEVPLIMRDANLDRTGNLTYTAKSSGFLGNIPLVNGTRDPYLDVDRGVYRFRVLNGANARLFKVALGNGAQFTLIGNDGGLLPAAVKVTDFEFSPGERLDLLVDFSGLTPGTKVMLKDLNSGWNLLEFRVTQNAGVAAPLPTTLSTIQPLSNPVRSREFSFDGMSRINGQVYDINRTDFQVPFGETEKWIFKTGGNAPHPVHVHGASFQVLSRSGGRGAVFPWERGWKDTVLLQDGETVEVLIRFDAYRGRYLLHCHKLEHEDMGMMSNFVVY